MIGPGSDKNALRDGLNTASKFTFKHFENRANRWEGWDHTTKALAVQNNLPCHRRRCTCRGGALGLRWLAAAHPGLDDDDGVLLRWLGWWLLWCQNCWCTSRRARGESPGAIKAQFDGRSWEKDIFSKKIFLWCISMTSFSRQTYAF